MNRRAAGVYFCAIGAFLIAVQFLTSAIYSLSDKWGEFPFEKIMVFVGSIPLYLGYFFIAFGLLYILWNELSNRD
ncbi:hypothetical protein JNUCC42_06880 [Brevibacterium sp. JNUCC-42]|uniref:Uncharacterized protein n=1 Tax=Brevibacillus laterosporus TaxID=1465 RepID=A0A502H3H0_BRELA|nr:hypothetical protein [Brevibacillus laterosporus]QDX93989.1 hypothetical protein EEL30_17840 [Brevibacillus laterosporus]QOT00424.1 hypothetical protein JNUCC42_06880 [Brevibacterium sp. JNUCC-42]TPG67938.1 hypothetical protein EEL31_04735 [Brevibacillus laterosporus]TPG89452.1 hypothetical protein EEL32_04860 [Brevibacillus laterosporus]